MEEGKDPKQAEGYGNISFDLPKNKSNVIKVIGVGGGGGNAINHMFQAGINGVDFVICNTDAQALQNSTVPNKIQLGVSLTEGLGAGANPEIGEKAAMESMEDIKAMFGPTTKMVFITAGMGGGTGTGAAPIIAQIAKEMDILTVGIVTIPFQFEGTNRCRQAQLGIEKLRNTVDSLIVVNNNKLREIYGNLGFKAGFSKADEVLATAARGIAEVITHHYTQNIDLRDAKTVLSNSGTAIMGSSLASGSERASEAISKALDSPLLNDNKIRGAKNVLLLIVSGGQEITIDEIGEINDHIQAEAGHSANIIMGVGEDGELGESIAVTVIATGFDQDQQDDIVNTESKKIIHTLDDEQRAVQELGGVMATEKDTTPLEPTGPAIEPETQVADSEETAEVVRHQLEETPEESETAFLPKVTAEEDAGLEPMETSEPDSGQPAEEAVEERYEPHFEEVAHEPLIATTKAIFDLPVSFEVVEPLMASGQDFIIIDTSETLRDIDVVDPEVVSAQEGPDEPAEDQFTLSFELTGAGEDVAEASTTVTFDLEDDTQDQEVGTFIEVDAVYEEPNTDSDVGENGEKRYDLQEYMDFEERLTKASPEEAEVALEEGTEGEPFLKKAGSGPQASLGDERSSGAAPGNPFDNSIDDILKERADERRRTLKEQNHKFKINRSSIEEIEKEPAYKRQGIDISETPQQKKVSRTTLGEDSNDEIQLRSNNSFLHDNVD